MSKRTTRKLQAELKQQINDFRAIMQEYKILKDEDIEKEQRAKNALDRFRKSVKEGDIDIRKLRFLYYDMSLLLAEGDGFENKDEGMQLYQLFELLNEL